MTTPTALERLFQYMRAFEVAYLTGDWSVLEPHFADDARHGVEGGGPFGVGGTGRDGVIAGLRAGVDGVDRRFDVRIPEVIEGPATAASAAGSAARGDGVWMRFALTLRRAGLPDLRVEGTHLATVRDGRIARLEERLRDGDDQHVAAYLAKYGNRLSPPGSPFALPASSADREQLEAAVARSLVRCYGAAKSEQDTSAALSLCGEDFSIETVAFGLASRDRKESEQQLALFFASFPDYAVTLDGLATGPGHVACWGRARMTFAGDFLGLRATGKTADLAIFCVIGVRDGVLHSERFDFSLASLCEQIDVPVDALVARLAPLRAAVLMAVVLRPACATDVPFLASVLHMAGRGHLPRGPWDLLFPEDAERGRALEHLAGAAPRSWCHASLFDVADDDGDPCAALVSFEADELGDVSLAKPLFETLQVLDWKPARVAAIGPLLAPYLRCFPDMPAGRWIVENVGTRPDRRRRGLVAALLAQAVERGRVRGYRTAQISCLIGNDATQRAYEQAAFAVVEQRTDAEFERVFGAPGFSRMIRAL